VNLGGFTRFFSFLVQAEVNPRFFKTGVALSGHFVYFLVQAETVRAAQSIESGPHGSGGETPTTASGTFGTALTLSDR